MANGFVLKRSRLLTGQEIQGISISRIKLSGFMS